MTCRNFTGWEQEHNYAKEQVDTSEVFCWQLLMKQYIWTAACGARIETFICKKLKSGQPWHSSSTLDFRSTGWAIDSAPGAWFIPKFITSAQIVPSWVYLKNLQNCSQWMMGVLGHILHRQGYTGPETTWDYLLQYYLLGGEVFSHLPVMVMSFCISVSVSWNFSQTELDD